MPKYQVKISIKVQREQHDELLNYLSKNKEESKQLSNTLGASFYIIEREEVSYYLWLMNPENIYEKLNLTSGSEVLLLNNELLIKDHLDNILKKEEINKMNPEMLLKKLIESANEYLKIIH